MNAKDTASENGRKRIANENEPKQLPMASPLVLSIIGISGLIAAAIATSGPSRYVNQQGSGLQGESSQTTFNNTNEQKEASLDPAIEISESVFVYPDPATPHLNATDEYKRVLGDLARVQEHMLTNRSAARRYAPTAVGAASWNEGTCKRTEPTLGNYYPSRECMNIQVNFRSGAIEFESPIEVSTVIAHEYGHHLINLVYGTNVSGLENEMLADCFAGVMHGYWDKWGKLRQDELLQAGRMMTQITKQAEDTADPHGDMGQRLGAFLAGALRAKGTVTQEYQNYCHRLDGVLNWNKGLP